jgi:hypothetical protein
MYRGFFAINYGDSLTPVYLDSFSGIKLQRYKHLRYLFSDFMDRLTYGLGTASESLFVTQTLIDTLGGVSLRSWAALILL